MPALAGGLAVACVARFLQPRKHFNFRNRVAVITGGSRGLGLVLARQLAKEGAALVLLARGEQQLRRAESELNSSGAVALGIPCDVRDALQVEAAIERAVERFGRIDVVINNAGIIQVGPLEAMTLKDFEDAMAVHFFGALYTTMAALPYLRQNDEARIVNIASIGGKIAVPHMLPYVASKFALVGFSDALRAELRRAHIFVTTVCPGLMRTGSPPNALFKGNYRAEYAWFALSDGFPLLSINAERAAKKIIAACRRKAPRLIISMPAKAAVLMSELFPGTTARLAAQANRLMPKPDGRTESHSGWESQSKFAPSILTRLSETAAVRNNEVP